MTYQEQVTEQGEAVAAQVLAVLAAYEAATITYETAAALIAAYVAAGNTGAAVLGDLALSVAVTVQTGTPAAPLGITRPASDPDRLTRAAQTILDDLNTADAALSDVKSESADLHIQVAQTRLQRLAVAEVRKAAHDAHNEAVRRSPAVTGWVRDLEPEACQLCRWWHRDGRVWPADHPMPRHTGCDCGQRVVTTTQAPKPVRNH